MTIIRKSARLSAYQSAAPYQVPAGKGASVSVALLNPRNAYVFVQKTSAAGLVTLGAGTAYTPVAGSVYNGQAALNIDSTSGVYKIGVQSATWPASVVATSAHGIQFRIGLLTSPESALNVTLGGLAASGGFYRSIPTIDYQADPAKIGVAGIVNGGIYRFVRGSSLEAAYKNGIPSAGYSAAITYANSGMAAYGGAAIALGNSNGNTSYITGGLLATSVGVAGVDDVSPTAQNGPYGLVAVSGLTISFGSAQVFFVAGVPYFWLSAHSASSVPWMARIAVSSVEAGTYGNAQWERTNLGGGGPAVADRLHWCRYSETDAAYYCGTSAGKIYRGTSFNSGYAEITGKPADVDAIFPPVRISASKMAFRSSAGGGHWEMTAAPAPTWTFVDITSASVYSYTPEPLLASQIAAAGITVLAQTSTGSRPIDKLLYTATQKYQTSSPFDTRSTNADWLQRVQVNTERTNIALEENDILHVYSESDATIAHVYGIEE